MNADQSQFEESEPKHFGTGWISGVLSVCFGAVGLLAVLCFHYPALLTMPELRAMYPVPYVRALLFLILTASFGLGGTSIYLRRSRSIGGIGILLTLIAVMFGGSSVPVDGELGNGPFLGLDWFLLNIIAFSLIFVPIEHRFPLRPEQPIFREFGRPILRIFLSATCLSSSLRSSRFGPRWSFSIGQRYRQFERLSADSTMFFSL